MVWIGEFLMGFTNRLMQGKKKINNQLEFLVEQPQAMILKNDNGSKNTQTPNKIVLTSNIVDFEKINLGMSDSLMPKKTLGSLFH